MNTRYTIGPISITPSTAAFILIFFLTSFPIEPASARSYCDTGWSTELDPDKVVWLPYKTYCDRFQTISSNPSWFLIDDYPANDLANCRELGTAWRIEHEEAHSNCSFEPASGYSTHISYEQPLACNGNVPLPEKDYYFSARIENYRQDFDMLCPGYPTQTLNLGVATKYYVHEPVGAEEPIEGKNRGNPACGLSAGNPVNIATGNKFHAQHDAELPEGLIISRYYNSSDTESHSFGRNWRSSYSRHITAIYSGDESSATLTLVTDDGAENYWRIKNGALIAPPDAAGKLDVAYDNGQVLGFTLVTGDSSIETYDAAGKLLSIEEGDGHILTFAYMDNRLTAVTASSGRSLNYSYLPDGKIHRINSTGGSTWNYLYDVNDNLSRVEFPDGSVKTYHYEDERHPHALTGVTDENGNRIRSWAYDDSGRAILSTYGDSQSDVERHAISYNDDGTTTTTNPLQLSIDHSFRALHGMFKFDSSSKACNGCASSAKDTTYDDRGNRDLVTDFSGNSNDYDYTPDNLIQKVTYAVGTAQQHEVSYAWDEALRKPLQVNTVSKTTEYTYNARGQLLTRTETDTASGAWRTWTYSYFEKPVLSPLVGKPRSIDGPRIDVADITLYEYYDSDHPGGDYRTGDLRSVTNPLGHRTEYLKYDGNGRLLEMSDPNGVITSIAWHPRGWTASTTSDGETMQFNYDRAGNLTGLQQPDGSNISYEYDNYQRLVAFEDGLGNRVEYTLDAAGNRISERTIDSQGNLRRQLDRVYNSLNQLAAAFNGNNHEIRYEYDVSGNRTGVVDANLNATHYEYDSLDRLVKVIDPIHGETVVDHDTRGNPLQVADPMGNVTQYQYDGLDNQVSIESPDTGNTRHEYDAAGNRIATTDARGVRTTFTFDSMNRLLEISYPDRNLDVSFGYDEGVNGKGRLTSMLDASGLVEFAYDRRGNLLSETRSRDGSRFVTSFAYNSANILAGITYPSGMVIDYQLDAAGQVTSIAKRDNSGTETLVTNVEYVPFGPATSFTYGNGAVYSSTLNRVYETEQIQSGPGLNWSLGHDPAGNVIAINDQVNTQKSQVFTYDDLYRLDSAQGGYGSETYVYDANGNRTHFGSELTDEFYTYEPRSNRLAARDNRDFTRDASGNRTGIHNTDGFDPLYSYGDDNRLSQVSISNHSSVIVTGSYEHNGRGQRVSKLEDGKITHFMYGLSGEMLGEYSNQPDGESTEYVYLNRKPIAAITRKVEAVTPGGAELILDNGDPGTSSSGSWKTITKNSGYGDDYLYASKSADRSYRWTATPPGNLYEVYAWWVDKKTHSDSVDYTIRYGSGETETVTMSHRSGGSQWQLLGVYHSTDGLDYVEVSSQSNKFVADAIRWVEIADPVVTWTEVTGFIHFDHLGTPRRVTDENQIVIWSWDSTPFGNSEPDQDPDGDLEDYVLNLRFPGQYYDAESGLHYNYYRTYDPDIGRYLESDPIGLNGGLNTFAYTVANPIRFADPTGLIIRGDWIKDPKVNFTDYGLNGIRPIAPYIDRWGYLNTFEVSGYATGYVNLDIRCFDSEGCDSPEWEMHVQIPFSYSGAKDLGPNIFAAGTGSVAGPLAGAAAGIFTFGASSLTSLLGLLQEANALGADKVQWLYGLGPDAICRGFQ